MPFLSKESKYILAFIKNETNSLNTRIGVVNHKVTRSDDIDYRHRREQRIEEDLRNYGWSPKVDISTIRRYMEILNKTKSTDLVR